MRPVTVDTGGPDDLFAGALVTWLHTPRGGYGHSVPVDAKVIAVGDRTTIEVADRLGRPVMRTVLARNLRWRGR